PSVLAADIDRLSANRVLRMQLGLSLQPAALHYRSAPADSGTGDPSYAGKSAIATIQDVCRQSIALEPAAGAAAMVLGPEVHFRAGGRGSDRSEVRIMLTGARASAVAGYS